MAKIIFFVAALLLVYWILKGFRKKAGRDEPPRQAGSGEDMVRCAQCGVHLPRSESITTSGQFFCSPEHQRLHRSSG